MNMLRLQSPVYTIDNELLLPQGTVLSSSTIDILVSSGKIVSQKKFSLLRHGTVKKDIRHFLGRPPYDIIFSGKGKITALFDLMSKVQLPRPLLRSLDYFHQNDFDTYRHTLMVFALSILLAKDLIQDHKKLIQEISTGPTHDFGKVCVPLPILKKNIPLTRNELGILRHHSAAGYVLLCHYLHDTQSLAARIARDHHERRDASGYPRGIHLNDRMVEIIATCDVYDALVSPRPYRLRSYDNRTALEEITRMAERNEIGWSVVKALVSHYRKAKIHFGETRISKEKRGIPPPGNLHGIIADEGGQSKDV
jgi:HD-GYP domain-containing protein (c-di-GMP phosphodiesterase class II)